MAAANGQGQTKTLKLQQDEGVITMKTRKKISRLTSIFMVFVLMVCFTCIFSMSAFADDSQNNASVTRGREYLLVNTYTEMWALEPYSTINSNYVQCYVFPGDKLWMIDYFVDYKGVGWWYCTVGIRADGSSAGVGFSGWVMSSCLSIVTEGP